MSKYGGDMALQLSTHQTVRIISNEPDCLAVETVYEPGGGPPPAHYHPAQQEHFTVQTGGIAVEVDGTLRQLKAGDALTIAEGQVHRMWNPGTEVAAVHWETRPALNTQDWLEGLGRLQSAATASGRTRPDALSFAALAYRHRNTFRLVTGGPKFTGDVVVAVLGAAGKLLRR